MRTITLPNGKVVSLRSYVGAWRRLKVLVVECPDEEIAGFEWFPMKPAEILERFREGMQERISAGVSYSERGVQS